MIESEQTEQLPQRQREPSQLDVAAMIANALGETKAPVRHSIELIVKALGRTQSRELLAKTLETEQKGGMMLPDNSRRRTVGGVFFYLAYTTGVPKPGKTLERPQKRNQKAKKPAASPVTPNTTQKAPIVAFTWEDRLSVIREADTEKGNASTVKITVIGRPGKILDKGQFIVTVMESTKVPSLPKGLPTPTAVATKYAVYVSSKQWAKVKESIQDPDDALIVEGYPKTDPEVSAIAVFATSVTTKKLQAATRQAK